MKLKYYFQTNWIRTLYFNFRSFPFKDAVKMPVIIFNHTLIRSLKGRITISGPVTHAMIKIGRCDVRNWEKRTTTLAIDGTLHFSGKAAIGSGSLLSVGQNATLTLGKKFRITAGTSIICHHAITIGDEVLSSWDNLIMDSDHHDIFDQQGELLNAPRPVVIGNHVWLGCRTTLLKGCTIPDGCVVASGSILTRSFTESSSIIGGSGAAQNILKKNICWKE